MSVALGGRNRVLRTESTRVPAARSIHLHRGYTTAQPVDAKSCKDHAGSVKVARLSQDPGKSGLMEAALLSSSPTLVFLSIYAQASCVVCRLSL